jgi:hypothetical protein
MSRATVSRSPFPSELSKEPMIIVDERSERGDASPRIHVYIYTSAPVILRTNKIEQLNCHSWLPSGTARVSSWLADQLPNRAATIMHWQDDAQPIMHPFRASMRSFGGRDRATEQKVFLQTAVDGFGKLDVVRNRKKIASVQGELPCDIVDGCIRSAFFCNELNDRK